MPDELRVAVVGLGKIGLPLAAQYASKGARVIGCDVDAAIVAATNEGRTSIIGEPGLTEALSSAHAAGRLAATNDTTAAVRDSNVVVVIVPVGIDAGHHADFRHLDAAAKAVGAGLQRGALVILESTVPVGVTRNRFPPMLRDAAEHDAFSVAYSPERVSSGTMFRDLARYPKVIGGLDAAAGEAAASFYRRVLDAEVLVLPDAETAEFAKLAESVYRDVNIALANELARAADALGVDYGTAVAAANSQPYSHLHAPGLGVGGHCIPVYPYFLAGADTPLIGLGRQINDSMASYGVDLLSEAIDGLKSKTVLILGLSYRGGVKEATLSSTLLVTAVLRERGARVLVHDPLFTPAEMSALGLDASELPPSETVDGIVLQAMHSEYANLDLAALQGARVFFDGRNAFDRARVEAAGLRYVAIGDGKGNRQHAKTVNK
jgi:nucleotide sugar dehydrogenase